MTNKTLLALLIAASFSANATDSTLDKLINGESIVNTGQSYLDNENFKKVDFSEVTESDLIPEYDGLQQYFSYKNENNLVAIYDGSKAVEGIFSAGVAKNGDANGAVIINSGSDASVVGALAYGDGNVTDKGSATGGVYISSHKGERLTSSDLAGSSINNMNEGVANGEFYITDSNTIYLTEATGASSYNVNNATLNGKTVIVDSKLSASTISGASIKADSDNIFSDANSSVTASGDVYILNSTILGATITGIDVTQDAYQNQNFKSSVSVFGNVETRENISNVTYTDIKGYRTNDYLDTNNTLFKNSTLNFGTSELFLQSVGNAKYYNFYVNDYNKRLANTDKYILNVTSLMNDNVYNGVIDENGEYALIDVKSTIKVAGISGVSNVKVGDQMGLIKIDEDIMNNDKVNAATISQVFGDTESNTVKVGLAKEATIDYIFDDVNQTATAVVKEVKDADKNTIDTNVKPLAEGRLAAIMNATRGNDELVSMLGQNEEVGTFTPMAKISGGVNKYGNSNNNVDSNDYRLIIGSRYQFTDNFYAGLAAEYGVSNYDTLNAFSKGNVNGSGNAKNYAMSLFAKYTNDNSYAKAAVSFGRASNNYRSNDVITGAGTSADYDSKANYISSLASVGYIYDVSDTYSFDTSLTYYFTKLNSDSVVIDGDNVKFKDSTSSRVNLREAFNYKASKNSTAYLAVAYEYEFDSKAKTSINNIDVTAPSAKGSTGIMELGIKGNPFADNKAVQIDFNVKGYIGERKGVTASIYAQYNF